MESGGASTIQDIAAAENLSPRIVSRTMRLSQLIAIARTASRGIQHPSLDIMGLLHGFEAFGEAASALAGALQCEQE
jgi:hypothetical protein